MPSPGPLMLPEEVVEAMAKAMYELRNLSPHIDTQGLDEDDCRFIAGTLLQAAIDALSASYLLLSEERIALACAALEQRLHMAEITVPGHDGGAQARWLRVTVKKVLSQALAQVEERSNEG